jgi:titin
VSVTVTVNGQAGPSVVATTGDTVVANVAAATAISVSASAAAAPGGVGATGATGPAGPSYTLPTASATVLGGIKVGSGLTITGGVLSSSGGSGGSSVSLSDATPSALGNASAGTSSSASRADHVHAVPVISYTNLTNVPSTFTPATHQHAISDVTGLQTALDGKQSSGTYATLVSGLVPTANLPIATTSAAGAVIVGTGLAISSGVLSATGGGIGANDAVDGGDYVGVIGTYAGAPTGVTGTASGTSVSLSWTAPTSNGGTAITDYTVQYSFDGTTFTTFSRSASTATSATVTGLTRGTAYTFKVAAVNSLGAGTYSTASSPITPPVTVPGQVTNVSGTAGDTQVSLSWTAPDNGGASITDYVVQYSTNGGTNWTTFADGTSGDATAVVTSLTNGTAYTFRVAAVNSAGTGSYSAASSGVTPRGIVSATISSSPSNFASLSVQGNSVFVNGTAQATGTSSGNPNRVCDGSISVLVAGTLSLQVSVQGSSNYVRVNETTFYGNSGTGQVGSISMSAGQSINYTAFLVAGQYDSYSMSISASFTPS